MNTKDVVRLRDLSAGVPEAVQRGLAKLSVPGPTPAQLDDLRARLAPLLHTPAPQQADTLPSRSVSKPGWRATFPRMGRLHGAVSTYMLPLAVAAAAGLGVGVKYQLRQPVPGAASAPSAERTISPRPQPHDEGAADVPSAPAAPVPVLPVPSSIIQKPSRPQPPDAARSSGAASADRGQPASAGREIEMLSRAVTLLDSNPTAALALANEMERSIPHGVLGEEREAVAIEALVSLGQTERARGRLDRFHRSYPRSVHYRKLATLVAGQSD